MEKAKVYFTDFRCKVGTNNLMKLQKLCKKAGIETIDFEGKFVAIKMHFGELGCLASIRPQYVKAVADLVKELGGKPFLTDCNTLYPGSRKHALEHLDCANLNGYNTITTGCQIIIGDGLRGTDEVEIPVKNGEYVQNAKIGRAIMDADVFISLAHFKGHEMTGFGGAIKNIGMGCGSRAGKKDQHSNGQPEISEAACRGCRRCLRECANNGLLFDEQKKKMTVNYDNCVGCGRCIGACNFDAIAFAQNAAVKELNCRMAEYAKAVTDGRPCFHISVVRDISPVCDCHAGNDAPILPDVGMFASFDPVALDRACADACLRQKPLPDSRLAEAMAAPGFRDRRDHFDNANPNTEYKSCLAHAEKIGLGTRAYKTVSVP